MRTVEIDGFTFNLSDGFDITGSVKTGFSLHYTGGGGDGGLVLGVSGGPHGGGGGAGGAFQIGETCDGGECGSGGMCGSSAGAEGK